MIDLHGTKSKWNVSELIDLDNGNCPEKKWETILQGLSHADAMDAVREVAQAESGSVDLDVVNRAAIVNLIEDLLPNDSNAPMKMYVEQFGHKVEHPDVQTIGDLLGVLRALNESVLKYGPDETTKTVKKPEGCYVGYIGNIKCDSCDEQAEQGEFLCAGCKAAFKEWKSKQVKLPRSKNPGKETA